MFGSDNFFSGKKINSSTNSQDSSGDVFQPVGNDSDNEKKTSIKSIAGVGIVLLVLVALIGLDRAVSDSTYSKKSKKKNKNAVSADFVIDDYDVSADMRSFKRDADSYKEKQGFLSSIFCGGYQKSSFCK